MKKETVRELKEMKYEDFLQTDYWKMVSEQARINAHFKCQLCGCKDKKLNVHHNTYEHRGEEFKHMEDLICLCEDCHNFYHRKAFLEWVKQCYEILNEHNDELIQRNNELEQRNNELEQEKDYAEWKLRLYYDSQKNHTSSEIERMVEFSIRESIDRERSDDVPF